MGNFRVKYILSVAIVLLFAQIAFEFVPTLRASGSARAELLVQDSTATTQRREARANRGRVDANPSQTTNQSAEKTAQSEISTDSLARKAKAALNMPITG
ncbi:MAG: hypothetical protein IKY80_05865, partial [Alistipes sp.]|nr:hypothetical protein [Alistipes sp.]